MSRTTAPPTLLADTTRATVSTTTPDPLFTLADATTTASDDSFKFPFWGYILIAAGVVVVLVLIFVAAKRGKTKATKQKKIAEYRTKEDKRFAAVAAELGEVYTATDHVQLEKEKGSQYYKKKGYTAPIKRTG